MLRAMSFENTGDCSDNSPPECSTRSDLIMAPVSVSSHTDLTQFALSSDPGKDVVADCAIPHGGSDFLMARLRLDASSLQMTPAPLIAHPQAPPMYQERKIIQGITSRAAGADDSRSGRSCSGSRGRGPSDPC